MEKQFVQHDYKIEIDEKNTDIRKYYLDDKPHTFVNPELVKVGCVVYFDIHNGTYGIVQGLRRDKYFQLYDVLCMDNDKVEEVAEFRVYKVC